MDRGRILHSKKSSLSCFGYVSILKATRQKQTRLVGNLSKILLLFSLHQLVTKKNKYLSTNISHIFCNICCKSELRLTRSNPPDKSDLIDPSYPDPTLEISLLISSWIHNSAILKISCNPIKEAAKKSFF